jgi:hypothetical protein
MEDRPKNNNLCKSFLNLFNNFEFNIVKKQENKKINPKLLNDLTGHLQKMLVSAKKDLSKAHKLHRTGKISGDELQEHEWRVFELEEELRRAQEDSSTEDELD